VRPGRADHELEHRFHLRSLRGQLGDHRAQPSLLRGGLPLDDVRVDLALAIEVHVDRLLADVQFPRDFVEGRLGVAQAPDVAFERLGDLLLLAHVTPPGDRFGNSHRSQFPSWKLDCQAVSERLLDGTVASSYILGI